MMITPVSRIRIDAPGAGFESSTAMTFEWYKFEPGTYTRSELMYTHQSGHAIAYASREEVSFDLIDFTTSEYAALVALGSVDVEITLGLPGEVTRVVTFFSTRLSRNYNITEGVQRVKVTALQITGPSGVIPVTQAVFRHGSATPVEFTLDLVECRVGLNVIRLPYRNSAFTEFERIIGFKRSATVVLSPSVFNGRQGFGSQLEGWILAAEKYIKTYNFFGETGDYNSFRQVVCTNSDSLIEERLDNIYPGRNLTLTVSDTAMGGVAYVPVDPPDPPDPDSPAFDSSTATFDSTTTNF